MRISASPVFAFVERSPSLRVGAGMPKRERSRMCEVPSNSALLPHCGLADVISLNQFFTDAMLHDCCAVTALLREIHNGDAGSHGRNVSN
jgi:hypothetical protein